MDTFAAIALASLPPSYDVMAEKPRNVGDSIISKGMFRHILGIGGLFTALLLGLLLIMQHSDITQITDLFVNSYGSYDGLSEYELSLFFTFFVMLQFWNMFNAKAFMTGKSAFYNIKNCKGFLLVAAVIFFGQILIVEIGGKMFNVCHLQLKDWIFIVLSTSVVMIIGEILRCIKPQKKN
jgi:Ca2+-transporting ATPase